MCLVLRLSRTWDQIEFSFTFGIRAFFAFVLHFRVLLWVLLNLENFGFHMAFNSFQSQKFVLNHRELIFGYVSAFRVKIGMKSKDLKLSFG
jgi:hypothetical protein